MKKNGKSNFTSLMTCLNQDEIKAFARYLRRFHPNHEMTTKIYPFYKKYHHKKNNLPEVKVAYQKLYKKAPLPNALKVFNTKLSKFHRVLKDFLIQEKLDKKQFQKDYLWLEVLQDKGLVHEKILHFNHLIEQQNEKIDNGVGQSFRLFQLHDFAIDDPDFFKTYRDSNNFLLALRYLEIFRLNFNLKYGSELKNREKILRIKNTDSYFKRFLKLYEANTELVTINTTLYFKLYTFLNEENADTYNDLASFFWKRREAFHWKEQHIVIYLINYIARQVKAGRSELNQEAFKFYQFAINKGFLIQNGVLQPKPFQSIINIACFLKKLDWAEAFIASHQQFLEESVKEQALKVALSLVYFKQKKYSAVHDLLKNTELKDSLIHILISAYYLASAYEINADINLEEKTNTLIKYTKRHPEIGLTNQKAVYEFANILKIMNRRKSTKKALEAKVEKVEHLYFRQWIEAKIETYQSC